MAMGAILDFVDTIQMIIHNICLYKENQKNNCIIMNN